MSGGKPAIVHGQQQVQLADRNRPNSRLRLRRQSRGRGRERVSGVLRRQRLEDSLKWRALRIAGRRRAPLAHACVVLGGMEPLDHIVRIVEQVGFPIALVLVMIVLAPRYALRLLEVFRKIMDDFGNKLLAGLYQ
jgi:hypothetical protein